MGQQVLDCVDVKLHFLLTQKCVRMSPVPNGAVKPLGEHPKFSPLPRHVDKVELARGDDVEHGHQGRGRHLWGQAPEHEGREGLVDAGFLPPGFPNSAPAAGQALWS